MGSMDTTMARGLLNHMVLLVMVWELLDILVMPQALLAEPSMDTHHSIIMARGLLMLNHMVLLVMFVVTVLELLDILVMPPALLAQPSMDTHQYIIMARGLLMLRLMLTQMQMLMLTMVLMVMEDMDMACPEATPTCLGFMEDMDMDWVHTGVKL